MLEDERQASINLTEWTKIQRKTLSMIQLAFTLKIKHNMLKEATLKALWGKLENIYVLKSLTNCLCLKMKLYQLKMKMGGNLHYHINKFNQPVSQLLNTNDKLFDRNMRCCCWPHYQGPSKLWFKRYLWEYQLWSGMRWPPLLEKNERMMRAKNVDDEHHALVVVESEWGRNHSRRHDEPRGRSKSQSHPQEIWVTCYVTIVVGMVTCKRGANKWRRTWRN